MGYTFDIQGSVKQLFDLQTFPSGFSKREFVVTTQEEYPQDLKFAFLKERAAVLDTVKPEEKVKVTFRIGGREYQGRYYVDLTALQLERVDDAGRTSEVEPEPSFDELMPEEGPEPF